MFDGIVNHLLSVSFNTMAEAESAIVVSWANKENPLKVCCGSLHSQFFRTLNRRYKTFVQSVSVEDAQLILFFENRGNVKNLRPAQVAYGFPGFQRLIRKDTMLEAFREWEKFAEIDFLPQSWLFPSEMGNVRKALESGKEKILIAKPSNRSGGGGIRLISNENQLEQIKESVIQSYIANPLLIHGRKFDLRIYILITSLDPLRVYLYDKALVRMCSMKYDSPKKAEDVPVPDEQDLEFRRKHLTNTSLMKKGSPLNETTWTSKQLWDYLENQDAQFQKSAVWKQIQHITKTIIETSETSLKETYGRVVPQDKGKGMCFEIFGADIMLDKDYKAWLLEFGRGCDMSVKSDAHTATIIPMQNDALNLVRYRFSQDRDAINDHAWFLKREMNCAKETSWTLL